jgi:hypothetical protein
MWAATLRLSHQNVQSHTSRKKGVMTTEVRAMVIQASREYALSCRLSILLKLDHHTNILRMEYGG